MNTTNNSIDHLPYKINDVPSYYSNSSADILNRLFFPRFSCFYYPYYLKITLIFVPVKIFRAKIEPFIHHPFLNYKISFGKNIYKKSGNYTNQKTYSNRPNNIIFYLYLFLIHIFLFSNQKIICNP